VADVLLTHSYHLPYDRKQVLKQQPYPPLGTLYAASLLRTNGISVSAFDTMLNNPGEGFAEALRTHRPRIVAIYEDDFNFLTKMCLTRMREVAWQMIERARASGARVIVHGSDATDHAADYLARGAEFVLIGTAEETLLEVVRAISRDADPFGLAGVASLRSPQGLQRSRTTHPGPDPYLARMPLPARDLIDLDQYRRAWLAAHGSFSLNMVASRGCPFRCNWCAKPIFGDSFYVRPAEEVAGEMQILKREYHADHIWFADDIFALNRHWAQQLATEVERLKCAVPFKVQARADLLTPETVRALRRAGCAEVWMGVESGSQRILDAMDKGLLVEEVVSARHNLKQEGIRACYFLQFGYPGEFWSDIRKTVDLVRETRPDDIGVSFSYPLPNTKFYDLVHEQLGSKRNWSDSDDLCVMFRGTYTDRFYRSIRDALHAEVDSWKQTTPSEERNSERIGSLRHLRELWRQIERAEPLSRNANPTELQQISHPSDCGSNSASDLVSIRALLPGEA
jgi:anaerobic magnesium-protoporphyrin IX monomethyl ester cyclase